TGDRVTTLEGSLSGTLAFVLSALESGAAFSEAVHEAIRLGMTEPDPRDDLSGIDVARKALILARLLGHRREMADVEVEGLVSGARRGSVASWLAALPASDVQWRSRVERARDAGGVLRFVASV